MIRRIAGSLGFGLPVGALQLVLAAGAAYLVWEHDQQRHGQPNMLCPICWIDKIVPAAEPPSETLAPE